MKLTLTTIACVTTGVNAWAATTGLRVRGVSASRTDDVSMKLALAKVAVSVPPPAPEPTGIDGILNGLGIQLPSVDLPSVDLDLGSIAPLALPVAGVVGLGVAAVAFTSLFPDDTAIESKLGAAFEAETRTPAMMDVLEQKRYQSTFKYKLIDPVVNTVTSTVENTKANVEQQVAVAKQNSADKKAKKAEEEARAKGLADGSLIELPTVELPKVGVVVSGVVVPSPGALAGSAKELLPF